jgi:sarcosine oxidase delta subunit
VGKKVIPTTVPGKPITSSALVQLRGTSGSGKTTAMKHLIDCLYDFRPVRKNDTGRKVEVYAGELPIGTDTGLVRVYILGDYSEGRSAGGCDTISSVQHVIDLLEEFGSKAHSMVVFEGLLLAHSWGAVGEYCHPRWGERYVNAFLDTPVDLCLARVHLRRAGKGRDTEGDRAAKIEKNIRDDYYRVELCYDRVVNRGGVRVDIEHADACGQFYKLVRRTAKKYCL